MRVVAAIASVMLTFAAGILPPMPGLAADEQRCGPRLTVDYHEASPSDLFVLTNRSNPGWSVEQVEIDLGRSRGGLIFDVTERGAGVATYQPYEEAGGGAIVDSRSEVGDGDSLLTIRFRVFLPNDRYAFTIDVDDTLPNSEQTQVSSLEMDGGEVRVWFLREDGVTAQLTAPFDLSTSADTGEVESCFVS